MSRQPRRAARIDANQPTIVKAVRELGWTWRIGGEGHDGWVGLVTRRGRFWIPVEVKDPAKPPSKRKLTPAEQDFKDECKAKGLPWALVETVDDVLALPLSIKETWK